jgi:spermidine synthase
VKPTLFQKFRSYFRPITIESVSSEQNPELEVVLSNGRLQLLSGNAIYSWDDLYRNFTVAFDQIDLDKRNIDEVLILGLGLGSIPFILEKKHHKNYHYTAIEWDEEVANLALKYALPRLKSSIDVVTADAEIFVEVCEEKFDLLIVDIFEDELVPPQFETDYFLEDCVELLNPKGVLLFNRLHNNQADKVAAERYYKDVFSKVLTNTKVIDTNGNWILFYEKED